MQNTQVINWWLEIAKIAVPSLITLVVGYLILRRTENYKKDLTKEIEDYKENKENRKYRLSKLEELHWLLTEYSDILDTYRNGIFELNESGFQAEKYNAIRKEIYKITKIQTVIRIYARELGADFDKLVEAINWLLDEGKKLAKREDATIEQFKIKFAIVYGIRRQLREDLEKLCDSYTGLYQ